MQGIEALNLILNSVEEALTLVESMGDRPRADGANAAGGIITSLISRHSVSAATIRDLKAALVAVEVDEDEDEEEPDDARVVASELSILDASAAFQALWEAQPELCSDLAIVRLQEAAGVQRRINSEDEARRAARPVPCYEPDAECNCAEKGTVCLSERAPVTPAPLAEGVWTSGNQAVNTMRDLFRDRTDVALHYEIREQPVEAAE